MCCAYCFTFIGECIRKLLLLDGSIVSRLTMMEACNWASDLSAPACSHAVFHVDFQKSPSSDFIWRAPLATSFLARGRPLRGQKRLAPLAKRSTCSKFKFHVVDKMSRRSYKFDANILSYFWNETIEERDLYHKLMNTNWLRVCTKS